MSWVRRVMDKLPEVPGRELLKRWGVPKKWRRLFLFWEVSMSAWLVDLTGLLILIELGVPVFVAACLSPLPALAWGFTVTTYKLKLRDTRQKTSFSRTRFFYYLLFNGTMLLGSAWVISHGAKLGVWPAVMKAGVSPVTFFLNFAFTRRVLKDKKAAV